MYTLSKSELNYKLVYFMSLGQLRIVLRKKDNMQWQGLIELDMNMGWSDTSVLIIRISKKNAELGRLQSLEKLSAKKADFEKEGGIIFNPISFDCPVDIDWCSWLEAKTNYTKNNAPFSPKLLFYNF